MTWLEKLDRRWIFLTMGLLVLVPLLFPLALPLSVSPPARSFAAAIAKVPDGSTVLMSCDYDPGAKPELVPMTRTALSAPEYYPYLQAGQLLGLLGGMAGAAEYEKLRGEKGAATRGMDAQSMAHVFVAVMILAGNAVLWSRRRRGQA